ncbi:uncharacterized protein AMSG_08302 [Thecamonas trahens ATCC 50062]|uniref:Uncharacterized protein n=1 Tax=Thecamonas trahens ATCC 50062 TaxID=461836 RepID=A0A0L0DLR1_THETB|nr:hypothetical protein AMSG_08302 [Thecamonas trahens ATCC 50062]KNC52333.1 hypothetical protein AMSG_08302 [Thecamonas trahens ATCC 50062]|eukprot:XP_013755383.1 hypothetical protein AMSG_08302 [Thecamonas trahens ATCC 50062]
MTSAFVDHVWHYRCEAENESARKWEAKYKGYPWAETLAPTIATPKPFITTAANVRAEPPDLDYLVADLYLRKTVTEQGASRTQVHSLDEAEGAAADDGAAVDDGDAAEGNDGSQAVLTDTLDVAHSAIRGQGPLPTPYIVVPPLNARTRVEVARTLGSTRQLSRQKRRPQFSGITRRGDAFELWVEPDE